MKVHIPRTLQVVAGGAIWLALVIAVLASWGEVKGDLAEAGVRFPISVLLLAGALITGARGWSVLRPTDSQRRSMIGYLAAQPAKYLPAGGALQGISQVGLSLSGHSKKSDVAWSFVVHAGIQVAAASLVSLLILGDMHTPFGVKVGLIALAIIATVGLRRPVIQWIVGHLTGIIPRLRATGFVPESQSLLRSTVWTIVALLLAGSAFSGFLNGFSSLTTVLTTIGVFSISWLVGFLAFPLPSGVGAREGILVLFLPALPAAQVVGISLLHRFATIVAELVLLVAVSRNAFVKAQGSE